MSLPIAHADGWTSRVSGTTALLGGVVFGNGRWVAVGEVGAIVHSNDAITWASADSGTTEPFRDVCFGLGQFVAVGFSGTVLTSPNGSDWTPRDSSLESDLSAVAFGAGVFVASGSGGKIIRSTDGASWIEVDSPVNTSLEAVAYANGQFIAVGTGGTILRSPDGSTWSQATSGTAKPLLGVTGFADKLYAVGLFGTARVSDTGETWGAVNPGTGEILFSCAGGANRIVAVGDGGTIVGSADGTSWSEEASGVDVMLHDVAYGNGLFVAVGAPLTEEPNQSAILTSVGGPSAIPLPIALDTTDLLWTTTGSGSAWTGQSTVSHDATDAGATTDSPAGTEALLSTAVEGPVELSFFWKLSPAAGDSLALEIDGVAQASLSAESDWTAVELLVPAGSHSVDFSFTRSLAVPPAASGAWLDQVTVTTPDYSFDAWLPEHFSPDELLDPAISGRNADPDDDGIDNLSEYFFALDPRVSDADSQNLPVLSVHTDSEDVAHFTLTYRRHAGRSGFVLVDMESSPDLSAGGWTSVVATEKILATEGEIVTVRVVETAAFLSEEPTRFYRLFLSYL